MMQRQVERWLLQAEHLSIRAVQLAALPMLMLQTFGSSFLQITEQRGMLQYL